MARFADFYDFILPSVRGCELPLVDFELRKAIRDWQRSTTMWRETIPLTLQPGVTDYRLAATVGLVAGIVSMPYPTDPSRFMHEIEEGGRWPEGYLPEPGTPDGWWQTYPGVLRFNRPPDQAYPIQVGVYKQLSQDVDDDFVPDDLFNDHAEKVASGALAALLAQPVKPWRDISLATYHNTVFTKAKLALRGKLRRGGSRGTMRVVAPPFAGRIR